MIQNIQNPLQLTIFNNITLNRKFLFGVLSATLSYVIVLIQYELDVRTLEGQQMQTL